MRCAVLAAVSLPFVFTGLPLHAADLSDLTFSTTNGEVTITDCDPAATGELVIPDNIEGSPVTSIGEWAFNRSRLTSITIPDSVTSIEDYAFSACTRLTSITIPDSVTTIGRNAFYRCSALTSITIGNGVTSIGERAFSSCSDLTSIEIPDSVARIEVLAFIGCINLLSITIPDSVTTIGDGAFYRCSALTSITIPDSVTSIGDSAFLECSSLSSITFLGTAPTVGANSFGVVADGARAYVGERFVASFGTEGSTWTGLTVAIQRAITACGFMNATTFFIEFEPAGAGYRVMSSPTLDFGNSAQVTPTLEPTSAEDNRFEFAASSARNFYRLEPIQ